MNICVLYYDGFCEFEIAIAALQFIKHNLITVALENRMFISEEKQQYLPHKTLKEVRPEEIDLLIIPGGDPSSLYKNSELREFILDMDIRGKFIAGICGGTELMAAYGVLNGRKCTGGSSGLRESADDLALFKNAEIVDEDVVQSGNVITSIGKAYVEFAIKLNEVMGVYENAEELVADMNWFKNIK